MSDPSNAVEIALLQEQMEKMNGTLTEIKEELKELFTRNDKIVTIAVELQHAQSNMATLWRKHDELKEATEKELEDVKQFMNQSKGSNKLAVLLFTIFGVGISTAVGWMFYSLVRAETINEAQTRAIDRLENGVQPNITFQPRKYGESR